MRLVERLQCWLHNYRRRRILRQIDKIHRKIERIREKAQ